MDATKRPLRIPPEFSLYAEKHGIFDLNKHLLELLIIQRPDDPIQYLIDTLKTEEPQKVPRIIVLGPPSSGKFVIGKMLSGRLRCPHVTMKNILLEANREVRTEVEQCLAENKPIPSELWAKGVKERLDQYDCSKKGWVLSGFPQSRDQVMAIQADGIFPEHVVLLDAPDAVLVERAQGKRIDPQTEDVYHVNFDPPTDDDVAERLEEVPGNNEAEIAARLEEYRQHAATLLPSYTATLKVINADQPMADVFAQSFDYVSQGVRSVAPWNPRVILIGPPGSGKKTQAALLASKYRLVDVHCGLLIREAIANQTNLGGAMKSFVEKRKPVPDAILLQLLADRLSQLDCVSRGWVLHGYPKNHDQAEQMQSAGYEPSRVFFLEVPNASVIERISQRKIDPITGERYHLVYNPGTSEEINARLVQHPKDSEKEVQGKLAEYSAHAEDLLEFYSLVGQTISADQDIHTVFELIEACLVNPIPSRYT